MVHPPRVVSGDGAATVRRMCKRVTCPKCERSTWAGCGAHIEQALADVPPAERCTCEHADRSYAAFASNVAR